MQPHNSAINQVNSRVFEKLVNICYYSGLWKPLIGQGNIGRPRLTNFIKVEP